MRDTFPLTVTFDGQATTLGLLQDIDNDRTNPLVRAVMISLFTWRRANADDVLPNPKGFRMGWWGDSFPPVAGDRIGSRLWLLARAKLTAETLRQAEDFAREALQWLVDDGVAVRVDVKAQRQGLYRLDLRCAFYVADGAVSALIQFADVWALVFSPRTPPSLPTPANPSVLGTRLPLTLTNPSS